MFGPFKSLNETWYRCLFIKMKAAPGSPDWQNSVNNFMLDAKSSLNETENNGIKYHNSLDNDDTMSQVTIILDSIFNIIIVITMLLCLFSLVSSMSANLLDQTKEIGVLRAMGFTKRRI